VKRLIPFVVILAILAWITQSGSLFFLLLIFAGMVMAAKKVKKASTAKDPAKLPPWQQALQSVVAEIRRELQQRAGQQPSQTQGTPWSWEQLVKPAPKETAEPLPMADAGETEKKPSEKRLEKPKMAAPAKEVEKKKPRVPSFKREPPPVPMPPPAPTAARTVADELEQAIVWSEIISPPLALRDRD
jgi:hypothetical protein